MNLQRSTQVAPAGTASGKTAGQGALGAGGVGETIPERSGKDLIVEGISQSARAQRVYIRV